MPASRTSGPALNGLFGYDLSQRLGEIRDGYRFDISCQGSVPQSVVAFLESDSYEDATRNAISLGGDADTMAAIAGGIAEAFYGSVPEPIRAPALDLLDRPLRRAADGAPQVMVRHTLPWCYT